MKVSLPLLPLNFAQVDDILYRSAMPVGKEIKYLKDNYQITDVFNLSNNAPPIALTQEIKTTKELGINYHSIPSETDKPVWEKIQFFVNSINDLKSKGGKKALVHCNAGVDRTGTYVLFYQLMNKLKSYEEAVKEMIKMGHYQEDVPKLMGRIKDIALKMKLI